MSTKQWGNSTFLARPLPTAIIFDNGEIIGPFCAHCGAIQEWHGPGSRCPLKVNPLWPVPCCGCHAVMLTNGVPKPNMRVRVANSDTVDWVVLNDKGQITIPAQPTKE